MLGAGILRSSEIVPRLQLPAAVLQGERPAGRPPAQHQEQEQAQAQEEEMEREAEERESEREEGGGSFARSDARSVRRALTLAAVGLRGWSMEMVLLISFRH